MKLRNASSALSGFGLVYFRSVFRRSTPGKDLHVLFDTAYYLACYPDVAQSRWHPLWHYILVGAAESRNPNPLFDTRYYLECNADVRQSGINPLLHYVLFGAAEGRNPHPTFNTLSYVDAHPEARGRNALVHYRLQINMTLPAIPEATGQTQAMSHAGETGANRQENGLAPTAVARMPIPTLKKTDEASLKVSTEAKLRMLACSNRLSQALSTKRAPLISAIIPCFNYGRYIWDAVGSLLAQSYPNIEVIVIDDGSTDPDTARILDTIRHARVHVIHQFNQGLAQARNNGAAIASGEYLLFLDADDILERHAAALMLYALQRDPTAAYAYSYQRFFGDQELVWETQEYNAYDVLWSNHPSVCCLIDRRAFDDVGGYRPEMLFCYEDWELFVRLSGRGHHGLCVPAPVFGYRRHGISMAPDGPKHHAFLCRQMLALNRSLYEPASVTKVKAKWRPLLSIVMPFYNRTRYLKETLASLEAQTTRDFELILVNDGSNDPESLELLNSLRKCSWIRVADSEHMGPAAARNRGAVLARAELLMFLDSDDLLDPGAIEKLCWTIAINRDVAFAYSGVVHFGDIEAICYEEFDASRLHRENYLTVTSVIRREVFMELGGNDPSLTDIHEDYDFWLRLIERGYYGKLLPEPLFHYRRHCKGISTERVMAARVGADEFARSVVTRHMSLRERPPKLAPVLTSTADELVAETCAAVADLVPAAVPRDRYRRPNLPNLFCPRRWEGDKITLLYLIPFFHIGGAEAFDLRIMECLPREKYYVIVVACEASDGSWHDDFKAHADEIYSLPLMTSGHAGQESFLRYLMVSKSVDVVINRNTLQGYELCARWPAVSAEVRYVDILHVHASGEDWVRASAAYHSRLDLRYVTSEDLPDHAARTYDLPAEQFTVLDYGLDQDEVADELARATWRQSIREKWGIPASAFVVGSVARLTPQKDPLRWISVASKISEQNPDAVFLIVGGGEMLSEVKAEATRLGLADKVVFTDYQPASYRYCAAMDVLLMTSKFEGLPLTILHALAHGTPVVSSDVGGIHFAITNEVGRILPLEAADASYADAVLDMERIQRGGESVAASCRNRVASQYSKDRMALCLQRDLAALTAGLQRDRRRKDYELDLMSKPILP